MPVVRIARMGGQYAKPRSSATEVVDGATIPSFRGDIVNGFALEDRAPDPERLLGAYFHSSATANHVRSLLASGFASLPTSQDESVPWSLPLEHVRSPELLKSYEEIVRNLSEALEFLAVVGVGGGGALKSGLSGGLESAEIFLSHEVRFLSPCARFGSLPDRCAGAPSGIRDCSHTETSHPDVRKDGPERRHSRLLLHERVSWPFALPPFIDALLIRTPQPLPGVFGQPGSAELLQLTDATAGSGSVTAPAQ